MIVFYHLEFDKQFDLCMCFMRYQETYESSRKLFRDKPFTLVEYMKWQAENQGNGKFTYPEAWVGFNLPFNIIADVMRFGISDPNMYDSLMSSIYKQVLCVEDEACYLIGSFKDDTTTLDHELTHAVYYTNLDYRVEVNGVLDEFSNAQTDFQLLNNLRKRLTDDGYRDDEYIIRDEINAYITTGDNGYFTKYKKQKNYRQLKSQLMKLWNEYVLQ